MFVRTSASLLALGGIVIGSLALAGCSSSPQPKAADSTATPQAALTGNPWQWVATQTPVEPIAPAVTRMMCPPGSLDTKYLQQLNNPANWFFRGDTLYIDLKVDSGTMRFARGPAASE